MREDLGGTTLRLPRSPPAPADSRRPQEGPGPHLPPRMGLCVLPSVSYNRFTTFSFS